MNHRGGERQNHVTTSRQPAGTSRSLMQHNVRVIYSYVLIWGDSPQERRKNALSVVRRFFSHASTPTNLLRCIEEYDAIYRARMLTGKFLAKWRQAK